jgi:hypothetical protein
MATQDRVVDCRQPLEYSPYFPNDVQLWEPSIAELPGATTCTAPKIYQMQLQMQ